MKSFVFWNIFFNCLMMPNCFLNPPVSATEPSIWMVGQTIRQRVGRTCSQTGGRPIEDCRTFGRSDSQTDGLMVGRSGGRSVNRTDDWTGTQTGKDGRTVGRTEVGWSDGRSEDRKVGKTDVMTVGRTVGRTVGLCARIALYFIQQVTR